MVLVSASFDHRGITVGCQREQVCRLLEIKQDGALAQETLGCFGLTARVLHANFLGGRNFAL